MTGIDRKRLWPNRSINTEQVHTTFTEYGVWKTFGQVTRPLYSLAAPAHFPTPGLFHSSHNRRKMDALGWTGRDHYGQALFLRRTLFIM